MLNIDINNVVTPDPETLTIPQFKTVWDKDNTKHKDNAKRIFGYLYFKYNPKSVYIDAATGVDLDANIKRDLFGDPEYKMPSYVEPAETVYKNNMVSLGMRVLNSAQHALNQIGKQLDQFDLDTIEDFKDRIEVMSKIVTVISKLDSAAISVARALKALRDEQLAKIESKKELFRFEMPPEDRR